METPTKATGHTKMEGLNKFNLLVFLELPRKKSNPLLPNNVYTTEWPILTQLVPFPV